ncbi:MAG: membrane protein insertase YidC [Candidatus Kerfeldbacteria bacterium]|nr:membrane protein insertase YidC [Candidatus Kerfeldbacteria bacterium]
MIALFNTVLYDPILNLLLWVRTILPGGDLGIAIILVTILIKLLLMAPSYAAIRSQKALQDIQPKVDALRAKYKKDQQTLSREMIQLYRTNKVNPLSSCLPLLIQFPILIALYQVFLSGIRDVDGATGLLGAGQLAHLYEPLRTVYASMPIPTDFLGLVSLTAPSILFAVLAAGFQFWQGRMLLARRKTPQPSNSTAAMMNRNMLYLAPGLALVFGVTLPAGLTLYWIVSTLFTIGQQYVFLRHAEKRDATPAPS